MAKKEVMVKAPLRFNALSCDINDFNINDINGVYIKACDI
jgi:hypothetical protein